MSDDIVPTDHRPRPSLVASEPTGLIPAVVTDVGERRAVTCPECGSGQRVVLNRRESSDFCTTCDFPLFWTPNEVHRDGGTGHDDALRRLPGTVGRATIASLVCPTCSEPNQVSAVTCVRCNSPLHPVELPAPPAPMPLPAPPEPVYEEPDPQVAWWVWLVLVVAVLATATVIVLAATHVI